MGWAMMVLVGVFAAGLMLALGLRRGMWSIVAAGLMVGAIGYALQGSPMLPGHPVTPDAGGIEVDPGITELRGEIFGRYGDDAMLLTASDGLMRAGHPQSAASLLLGAINHNGGDVALWTELGSVIATHDNGYVSPASLLAFHRASQLAPNSPGPPFFEGLTYVRAGDFVHARPLWAHALALTPDNADYRASIAVRVDLLDRYLAMMQQQAQ